MSGFELRGERFLLPLPIVGVCSDIDRGVAGVLPSSDVRKGDDLLVYPRNDDAVDLALANAGRAPILENHRRTLDYLLGAVTSAWLDAGTVCFVGKLAPVPEADRLWAFLSAGFPISLSIGAEIVDAEVAGPSPWGGRRYQVHRWRLTEVSAVLWGADASAHAVRLGSHEGDQILATRKPGNPDAARQRLRLDCWERWAVAAGVRMAEALGADRDAVCDLLAGEVERQCEQLCTDLAG